MATQPLNIAAGILVGPQEKVFFGLRASWKSAWPDHWDAIGGRLELGETAAQALVRELNEEIGIAAKTFELLAILDGQQPELYGEMKCNIFAVTDWSGEPYLACDEHSQLRWFSVEELEQLPNLAGAGYPGLARRAIKMAQG